MAVAAERSPMSKEKTRAKPQGRPAKPAGEPVQVRIDADLVPIAKTLAYLDDVSMTDYLSGILRPILEQNARKAGRKLLGEDQ